MTATWSAAGPPELGLDLGRVATTTEDGWLERAFRATGGLNGTSGTLQGGFASGVTMAAARLADGFGAPITSLDARLRAPTPVGRELEVRVRPTDAPARHEAQTRDGEQVLVEAEVELAGHDPSPQVPDLLELAHVPLPVERPREVRPTCWVCGPRPVHPLGQRLLPRWHGPETVVCPWVADDEVAVDGVVHPVVVNAMLACPAAWASFGEVEARGDALGVLGRYHVRFFRDAPVMEPLRLVARSDGADGRRLHARSALVDEDAVVYAMSSAVFVSVPEIPGS